MKTRFFTYANLPIEDSAKCDYNGSCKIERDVSEVESPLTEEKGLPGNRHSGLQNEVEWGLAIKTREMCWEKVAQEHK